VCEKGGGKCIPKETASMVGKETPNGRELNSLLVSGASSESASILPVETTQEGVDAQFALKRKKAGCRVFRLGFGEARLESVLHTSSRR
jgi:hypothetical protein